MPIDIQKQIFIKNLSHYMNMNDLTQKEVADAIGVSPQTFNTWMQGIALPRMGKIQALADYFGIKKSDLIDDKENGYYFDAETAKLAQELFEDKQLRMLFDAARDSRPEDLQMAADLLRRLKETNPDG